MKRKWWVVLAGVMGAVLVVAVWAARNGFGPAEPLFLGGPWEFKARSVLTSVDGEREREKFEGTLYIDQDGTHLFLNFDPPDVDYNGALGGRYLAAATSSGGGGGKQGSFDGILDARVNRRGTRIVGKIRAIHADYGYFGGFGAFESVRFTATRPQQRR